MKFYKDSVVFIYLVAFASLLGYLFSVFTEIQSVDIIASTVLMCVSAYFTMLLLRGDF
jgi:hypothetical protein